MKPMKTAYKTVRENDSEIYKAFGFRHLSDATSYYVHSANESYSGTTTLCQSIGEAVMFAADYTESILNGNSSTGEVLFSDNGKYIYIDLMIPQDWINNGVIPACEYKAVLSGTSMIKIAAYDNNGDFVRLNPNDLNDGYQLLPVILLLLMRELSKGETYRTEFMLFVNNRTAEHFVKIHEDLYQNNKNDDYLLSIRDITEIPQECIYSLRTEMETIAENMKKRVVNAGFDRFEAGGFRDEYIPLIPDISREEFVMPEELNGICSAVTSGDVRSLLFTGPAGTGKTMSCKLICREIGLPVMDTVNCTENLDEFVLGKFLPQDDKIVFYESYVTKAVRFGGAVIFEEINFARPAYLAFLNSLLDDNGFIRLDNGETVRRHENFRFFATMNHGYFGTKELNQALYNRFNAVIEISALSDEAIKRMLTLRSPGCEAHIENVLAVYHKICSRIKAEELDIVISPRNLENWVRLAKYEGYVGAAEKTIVSAARNDETLRSMIRNIVIKYKW